MLQYRFNLSAVTQTLKRSPSDISSIRGEGKELGGKIHWKNNVEFLVEKELI